MGSHEIVDHMPRCCVRKVALEAEATSGRILTDEEMAAIRERQPRGHRER